MKFCIFLSFIFYAKFVIFLHQTIFSLLIDTDKSELLEKLIAILHNYDTYVDV